MSTQLVALVGRPNVGKSTLFNRILGSRRAIEEKVPGVTRDRLYGKANWLHKNFLIVDTGGLTFSQGQEIEARIQEQAELAIEEAAVIIFVVDGRQGLTALDEEIANLLRRQRKPVLLAVNKIESPEQGVAEFYKLGLGDPLPISAAHGLNIGELLDKVIAFLPREDLLEEGEEAIHIAVVGRPNVGKSSFINTLLGEERVIVSEQPGTTRDPIDTLIKRDGRNFVIVDTAGIRRKSKVKENVEYYSVIRSLRAIESADIVLLLLEADTGVTEQDQKIAGYVLESGKALIIALNKWDLLKNKRSNVMQKELIAQIRENLKFVSFAPIIFTSIYEPRRLKNLFTLLQEVYHYYTLHLPTPLLNKLLDDIQGVNPIPLLKGKKGKIYYWTQSHVKPPTFLLFVNDVRMIHFSYLRYLENRLREAFDFKGTPIRLRLRPRGRKGGK
ncbi:MAG: ribosome biogenesis GTPase Der [Dethiobacteria bacterium]